jgi:hypothetical protein
MTALDRIRLIITGDPDSDDQLETGVFEMMGSIIHTTEIRTGYILGGRGSTVNSVISEVRGDGSQNRQGFFLDLGGGVRAETIQFVSYEGASDESGTPLQWGNTGDPSSVTELDATGAEAGTQKNCLMYWLENTTLDSSNPAELEYGQYHAGGVYSPQAVVPEQPQLEHNYEEETSSISGTLTLLSAAELSEAIDAAVRGGQ